MKNSKLFLLFSLFITSLFDATTTISVIISGGTEINIFYEYIQSISLFNFVIIRIYLIPLIIFYIIDKLASQNAALYINIINIIWFLASMNNLINLL